MSSQEIIDLLIRRKPWAAELINELFADWPPYDPEELRKVGLTRPANLPPNPSEVAQLSQDSVGEYTHTSSVPEKMVSKHGQ